LITLFLWIFDVALNKRRELPPQTEQDLGRKTSPLSPRRTIWVHDLIEQAKHVVTKLIPPLFDPRGKQSFSASHKKEQNIYK